MGVRTQRDVNYDNDYHNRTSHTPPPSKKREMISLLRRKSSNDFSNDLDRRSRFATYVQLGELVKLDGQLLTYKTPLLRKIQG